MKAGVVVFPGSNCDRDIIYVLENELNIPTVALWHKNKDLENCDILFLPGGFSYGDYLRSGAIARFSPIMNEVVQFANSGGAVIGICNGFQILTESGLLPGALLHNSNQKFICKTVSIKRPASSKIYQIPIAHGEGRYYIDKQSLEKLISNNQVAFQYCDKDGIVDLKNNPNGSLENIAGIKNEKGNVLGMMPHPERAASDFLHNTDGKAILSEIIDEVLSNRGAEVRTLK